MQRRLAVRSEQAKLRQCIVTGVTVALVAAATTVDGDASCPEPGQHRAATPKSPKQQLLIRMKTFGGRQFWGDVRWYRGWRIQQNVLSRHYRLLDPDDYRHASGSLDECTTELERQVQERRLEPLSGRAVILIHGIIRSSKSFGSLQDQLIEDGFEVIAFDYPSTQVDIHDSAEFLEQLIESLDGIEEINFIAHSLGGVIVRAWLDRHEDPRLARMVMMGVPNAGAQLASMLRDNRLFKAVFGPAGQQLVADPEGTISRLPIPEFEFGIIAGGRGCMSGFNPLLEGDDDGAVSVASTRLPGASDFIIVPVLHSFLMFNRDVVEHCSRFLTDGRFRQDDRPHPIPRNDAEPETESDDAAGVP